MPNQTPNYNLTKPLTTENYDIDVFNNNADIIDTTLKSIDTQMNENTQNINDLQTNKADLASPNFTGVPKSNNYEIATRQKQTFAIPLQSGLKPSILFKNIIEKDGTDGFHMYINVEKSDNSKISGIIQIGSRVEGIIPNGYCIGTGIAYDSDLSYDTCMLYVDNGRIMAHVMNPRSSIKGYIYYRCD